MSKARSSSPRARALAFKSRAPKGGVRLLSLLAVLALASAAVASVPSAAKLFNRVVGFTAAAAPAAAEKATVSTDRSVYEPGEAVTYGGTNFEPGEDVTIVVTSGSSDEYRGTIQATADERGSFVVKAAMPELGDKEGQEGRESRSKAEVIFKAVARGNASGLSARTNFKGREREEKEGEDDADIPRFMVGKIGKEDYLSRRQEHINRLRGVERGKPNIPGARGRAIRELNRQQGDTGKNSDSKGGATTAAAAAAEAQTATSGAGASDAGMLSFAMAGAPGWTSIGPSPIPNGQTFGVTHAVSGRVTSIALHPTNPDIAYVAAAQGGVYRTLDGGATWTAIFDGSESLAVGALALSPSQPSTLYVGTGEGNFSCDSYFGVGLYRIDNADGSTPALSGPFVQDVAANDVLTGRSISKIVVHPTNSDVIFLGVTNGIGGLGCDPGTATAGRGLYRSTNATSANATFQKLTLNTSNGGNRSVTDVEFEPGNPNTMLATVMGFNSANDGGVYRSTNALAAAPAFTRTLTTGTATATARVELAVNKVGGVTAVYAASSESNGTVFRSLDGGQTWSAALASATGFCGTQCTFDMPIAVDPTNASILYIGGNADGALSAIMKKSTNATAAAPTFAKIQTGLHADSHSIEIDPSNNNTVWVGNDGGVWKSANGGANWTSLNNAGFNATQFQSLALHPIDPNYAIGGTQDNGTERQRPDGTWTRTDYGDGGHALIDQSATGTTNVRQYHTYFNQAAPTAPASTLMGFATTTSSNAFENWAFMGCNGGVSNNGISCSDTAVLFYAPMALGPGTPNTVYFATDKLYRSANSGTTMTAVSQTFAAGVAVSAIGISAQSDNVRIVGLRNGKVYATTTGSTTMTDVTGTIPPRYISRAVIDPNNQNTAYVVLSTYFGNATAHVYKTTNLNSATPTWAALGGGQMPDVPVNAFVVDPSDSGTLYAGTDIGVFRSSDAGATWAAFSEGLPRTAVFDMAVHNPSRKLRIATHGRGIWEISVANSPAVIRGTVTAAGSNAPVANATVSAGSNTTTTDENGLYQFQSIPAGTYNMTVKAIGYANGAAANVAAANGAVTTRDFALTAAPSAACNVDTTPADFQAGLGANTDAAVSPGDVQLQLPASVIDAQSSIAFFVDSVTSTTWQAQTYTPTSSGRLDQLDFQAARSAAGTAGTMVVEVRNTVAGAPGATVLASATISAITGTGNAWYSVNFAAPTNVAAGTQYAVVFRAASGGPYRLVRANGNVYAGGSWYQSTTSGGAWSVVTSGGITQDLAFRAYVQPLVYAASGNLVSSPKDANQADGTAAAWTTISWNATTPAGTDVKFQAAGSNNAGGLYTFVGPDGTPNTYFTNGGSLAQFNGSRYLKYKAFFTTTNTTLTPTLADVTVCNSNTPLPATSLSVAPAAGVYGTTTTLTATLTSGGAPLAGKSVVFKLNGANFAGNTATTDAGGVATITSASLAGLNAGTYAGYVTARYASDSSHAGSNGAGDLTVEKATPAVVWNNPAAIVYGTALGASQLNATANVPGAFVYTPAAGTVPNAGDNQTLSAQFSPADATNYNTVLREVSINVLKAAPVVKANGVTCTYSGSPCEATGTATGVDGADLGAVTLVYTPGGTAPTGAGDYTVVASVNETANHTAGTSEAAAVKVNRATPVIDWSNPSAIVYGTPLGASQLNAATSVAGTFAYTPAAGTVLGVGNGQTLHADFTPADAANYTAASKDVSINVVKATLTVTTLDSTKVYGQPNPAFAVAYAGFLNGDTADSLGGALTFTTAATQGSDAGVYPVTPSGLTSPNYAFNFVAGGLNVTKAPLTVTADNAVRILGAQDPQFTVSYAGFVLGQGPNVLGGALSFSTAATAASPVGNYAVTPSGLTSQNYSITFVDGTLSVTYGVCALYDAEKSAQSNSTIPIKLQLCNAGAADVSTPTAVVHATSVVLISTQAPALLADSGNANPDLNFRYISGTPGAYVFNLSTKGYASGTYLLNFTVSGDPVPHAVKFSGR